MRGKRQHGFRGRQTTVRKSSKPREWLVSSCKFCARLELKSRGGARYARRTRCPALSAQIG
jgi:hypothetical protein